MSITFHPNGDVTGSSANTFGAPGTILQTIQGFSGTKTITNTTCSEL